MDYRIIVENNLFRPLGWKREVLPSDEPTSAVPPEQIVEMPPATPTSALVLTGIVKTGADWIAILEDEQTEMGVFLSHGEMLKDARVQAILPENIIIARGEMTVQLALGESIKFGLLDGRILLDTVATQKKPHEGTVNAEGEQDLLERMRARRQRELNQ